MRISAAATALSLENVARHCCGVGRPSGTGLPLSLRSFAAGVAKDNRIRHSFKRKGFNVTLMDRNDPNKPYDVRPFKGWLAQGRIVRKGQKGVMGLFHITQTDALPDNSPKPKGKAKPALKAVPTDNPAPTLPLV
jgi:hypothetical protein